MKKTILLLMLGLSISTYSQDIEKMDKKELRIALTNSNLNNDSLTIINTTKDKEIALLKQNLISSYDTIKNQKTNITSLLLLKTKSDEKSKILEKEVSFLRDSIQLLKRSTFNLQSFTFNDKEGDFDNGFSENKKMFQEKNILLINQHLANEVLLFTLTIKKRF